VVYLQGLQKKYRDYKQKVIYLQGTKAYFNIFSFSSLGVKINKRCSENKILHCSVDNPIDSHNVVTQGLIPSWEKYPHLMPNMPQMVLVEGTFGKPKKKYN